MFCCRLFALGVLVKRDQMTVWQVERFRNRHTNRGVIHSKVSHRQTNSRANKHFTSQLQLARAPSYFFPFQLLSYKWDDRVSHNNIFHVSFILWQSYPKSYPFVNRLVSGSGLWLYSLYVGLYSVCGVVYKLEMMVCLHLRSFHLKMLVYGQMKLTVQGFN